MPQEKQEIRSMIVALKVTPSEKLRIEWVAGFRGCDVTTLLREMGVEEIMREHARLSAAVSAAV